MVVFSSSVVAGQSPVEKQIHMVPYQLTATNHVLVRVKINGKGPFNFILDTGAPALFVGTSVARKLGIPSDKRGWGTFNRFEIEGGAVLTRIRGRIEDPFQLEGMNGLGLAGAELHGIIGYTILARFRIEFDFTKSKLTWQDSDFKPLVPKGLDGATAPTGMDAMAGVMKLVGLFLGKNVPAPPVFRGSLGIVLEETDNHVSIKEVLAGSPAGKAGLKPGDFIEACQGRTVSSIAEIMARAAKSNADQSVELKLRRGQEVILIPVKAVKGF